MSLSLIPKDQSITDLFGLLESLYTDSVLCLRGEQLQAARLILRILLLDHLWDRKGESHYTDGSGQHMSALVCELCWTTAPNRDMYVVVFKAPWNPIEAIAEEYVANRPEIVVTLEDVTLLQKAISEGRVSRRRRIDPEAWRVSFAGELADQLQWLAQFYPEGRFDAKQFSMQRPALINQMRVGIWRLRTSLEPDYWDRLNADLSHAPELLKLMPLDFIAIAFYWIIAPIARVVRWINGPTGWGPWSSKK